MVYSYFALSKWFACENFLPRSLCRAGPQPSAHVSSRSGDSGAARISQTDTQAVSLSLLQALRCWLDPAPVETQLKIPLVWVVVRSFKGPKEKRRPGFPTGDVWPTVSPAHSP